MFQLTCNLFSFEKGFVTETFGEEFSFYSELISSSNVYKKICSSQKDACNTAMAMESGRTKHGLRYRQHILGG